MILWAHFRCFLRVGVEQRLPPGLWAFTDEEQLVLRLAGSNPGSWADLDGELPVASGAAVSLRS